MNIRTVELGPISVIGKEGLCTKEHNIVPLLWQETNSCFGEVANLGMKEADGSYVGFWGLMSDKARQYQPWEDDFSTGLYLAGIEVDHDCPAPAGWVKWTVPKRSYLVIEIENDRYQETFRFGLQEALPERGLELCGAVCDYTEPRSGKNFLFFPCQAQSR